MIERGHTIVLVVIAFLVLGPTLGLVRSWLASAGAPGGVEVHAVLGPLGFFVLALGTSAALYWGSLGARMFLRGVAGLAVVWNAILVCMVVSQGLWADALLRGATCLANAALFWAVTGSKSVEAFLERHPTTT